MRPYFSLSNLRAALILAILSTSLSYPRLELTGRGYPLMVMTTLLGMTLVAGAAPAWGKAAGMSGCWPDRRRSGSGALAGALLGLALGIVFTAVDLPLRGALSGAEHAAAMALAFPPDAPSRWAAVLWAPGIETLLFQAGSTSFFARLLGQRSAAVAAATLVRGYVAFEQARGLHIDPATMVAGHMALAAIGNVLFAWGGYPAAAAFAATVTLRVFF